jgi:uncharacterized membrane protein
LPDQPPGFDELRGEIQRIRDLGLLPAQSIPSHDRTAGQRLSDAIAATFESPHFLTLLGFATILWAGMYEVCR